MRGINLVKRTGQEISIPSIRIGEREISKKEDSSKKKESRPSLNASEERNRMEKQESQQRDQGFW